MSEALRRMEALVRRCEALPAGPRETARALVSAVLELHAGAVARLCAAVDERRLPGVADDEAVAPVLLLHGLHPRTVEDRVRRALDGARPYLRSHGGDVALLGVEGESVSLRLSGACDGCPSSQVTLRRVLEDAIATAAPEVGALHVTGQDGRTLVIPLGPAPAEDGWRTLDDAQVAEGALAARRVEGKDVLLVRREGRLYAYEDACPRCGGRVSGGALAGALLACPGCAQAFDIVRAGRAPDDGDLHLLPVPLLVEGGAARIALEAAVG